MRQGEGRALCLRGVAFWEAAEGFRAGALGRSGRSAVAAPAEGSSRVPVSDRPGRGGRTGTGGHRPPPRGGGGRAEAQPERGTQGVPAGRDRRGRPTERSFRAAGENALGGGGGGRRHSGARTAVGGRIPGTWRHPTPLHSGRTAGRAQAAGLLGLRSAGKGLPRNGGPASRTVPGGVGSSLLETTAEAGQAVHPQTDQVCPIDRCTVLAGPGAAVCSLGSQLRRRDPSDEGARRRPRHPGPGRPVENHWTTGPRGGPAYPVPSNPEEDLGPSWELVRTG
ncbi:hypothetical protein NDU88_000774 [Pleurodeles waltl]|uniref:Uncharacterized protein n=1 Tax=Pleurodeles waltl TaxID=8319 RepID=A0AAV7U4H5_PLEWA|nr:hypothetical protein NDU88_006719 [Pleurodeles waltl]KAJ1093643.1 hypothetical protein NDU88_006741 [Pleurodeles waltl]KAJ1183953.1 hypothetical protein NDU88_000763 [Pleurodeles waltl]KAJ1183964.1 hypothetical protein NDU88_000774 [Pleurodeles waltl]